VIEEVEKYVAPYEGDKVSGHMTGASVDLRLWSHGKKVPMNDRTLSYQENVLSYQPKLPPHLQKNRQIMFDALTKAGLSNFPKEYWHWSYGDTWWAERTGQKQAIYGVITEFNKG
jgi:D-alanyl-D-alanine dipeptidase